jgi:hypothetical protein
MGQEYKKEIEEIIGQFKCPKDFICYKSGFEVLCRAKDIGIETVVVCLEKNPRKCEFSLPRLRGYICECPIRVYIAKKLKK